jgi:hypothetical protein
MDKTGHATLRDKPFSPMKEYEMLGEYYKTNKEKIEKLLASKTPAYR